MPVDKINLLHERKIEEKSHGSAFERIRFARR